VPSTNYIDKLQFDFTFPAGYNKQKTQGGLTVRTYENPIIPGFYPDPSICRHGEDYYIVHSSFEFFPGVPLWHSRDLVNWEQEGYLLTRESQLPLRNCRISGGIYAPTLRCHNGKFYLITTNTHIGGNFIVTAEDIHGPWSDPVWIDHDGIDPSLFWDEDGRCYYTGTWIHEDRQGIGQFEIDPETGTKLSDTKIIWHGTGGRCPEGPHMYKRDGWYYLLIAEGGTEYGHMVTIARSKHIWGPFESCPRNPILTHRDDIRSPFQALGHTDMVCDEDGNWWMVFHAIRPTNAQLHHIGRETMLSPFVWDEDGWPVVNGGASVTAAMTGPGTGIQARPGKWRDDLSTDTFHARRSWLRNPEMENYVLTEQGLMLRGSDTTLSDIETSTFLGVRQRQFAMTYETQMRLSGEKGCAGMTIFHTAEHHYDLCAQRRKGEVALWLRKRVADMQTETAPVLVGDTDSVLLRIQADRDLYTFYAGTDGDGMMRIGTGRTQLLSTEAMPCTFTGCFAGLFAEGETEAVFRYFSAEER